MERVFWKMMESYGNKRGKHLTRTDCRKSSWRKNFQIQSLHNTLEYARLLSSLHDDAAAMVMHNFGLGVSLKCATAMIQTF